MRLYLESIYTKKIFHMNLINILFLVMINFVFSSAFSSKYIQLANHETLLIDYLYQGILFTKINIFVLSLVLILQTKYIKGIIAINTINHDRRIVLLQYVSSLLIVLIINIAIFYLIFEVTGLFLTEYFDYFDIMLLVRLVLFGVFTLLMMLVVYFFFESVYSLLFTLIVYLIVIMNSGFYVDYDEFTSFTKMINIFVSDLVLNVELEYLFIYGDFYVFSLIMVLVIALVWRFNKIDLM